MIKKNHTNRLVAFGALLIGVISNGCLAGTDAVTVTVSGSVTQPTCKFNQGKSLDVKFNEVDVTKISTRQYRIPIGLKVSCGGKDAYIHLSMAAPLGWAGNLINTSVEGLGIEIFVPRVNSPWTPGTSHISRTQDDNSIVATLVARPGAKLKGGEFTSSITISVKYF
ncbi:MULTISPECIES: fimbrial protein [unclassified Pseudomonas]|uniref:fimbrial protein n=1 Tax=unclassified Pseudomonas TaxID=196821 RepID=UPI001474046F|nr:MULTISPECIES: fimbrial protein [unclassified Pseudomonas]NMX94017.1 fimbrial protein [Pseudomonas sp. WS 5086]NMY48937.1 fimbrial protein [Pseudomonas sp. WS 5027]